MKELTEKTKPMTREERRRQRKVIWEPDFEKEETDICYQTLAFDVIEQAVIDFDESWKTHNKKMLKECQDFLNDEIIEILSLGKFNGKTILEQLTKRCQKVYGKFVAQ